MSHVTALERPLHIVVVTGLSGAGRSTAVHVLEDLGFFCVDNLPPPLIPRLVELVQRDDAIDRLALGLDVRTGSFLEGCEEVLGALREAGHDVEVLFLVCSEEELVHRYSESRRPHPLAPAGDLRDAVRRETERLAVLRSAAQLVLDTTGSSVHELRRKLVDHVARGRSRPRMFTRIVSFGFKYGLPAEADLVFDVRFLPNPHFVRELRPSTGLDPAVARFVLQTPEAAAFLDRLLSLLEETIPRYEHEGKAYLTIAVGCTGGRHRSVAVAEELARRIWERMHREVPVTHRDSKREA